MMATLLVPSRPMRDVTGAVLHLVDPISFWGGVSPEDGRLLEPANAAHGQSVAGRILLIRELRGSSSASSVLLELIRRGHAPAAIVLAEADAILALGIFVAHEMDWPTPPLLRMAVDRQRRIAADEQVTITAAGDLRHGGS